GAGGPPHGKPPRHWSLIRIEYCPPRSLLSFSRRLLGGARRSPNTAAWLSWSSFLLATRRRSDGQALRACLVSRPSNRSSVPLSRKDTITYLSITGHVIRGNACPAPTPPRYRRCWVGAAACCAQIAHSVRSSAVWPRHLDA